VRREAGAAYSLKRALKELQGAKRYEAGAAYSLKKALIEP